MAQPLINSKQDFEGPPPTFEEAIRGNVNVAAKTEAVPGANPGMPPGVPVFMTMPVPVRNVNGGNVVYVVNQGGGESTTSSGNDIFGESFGDKAIRALFIRKVYLTLMLQLLTTVIFIAWFMFHEPTRYFVRRNGMFLMVAYVIFVGTYFTLVCCSSVRRSWPCNIITLSIFTLAMSYLAAAISAFHDTYIVFMTMGIVAVVCLGISIFSIQTKWDITGAGIYLFVFGLVLFLFGIVSIIVVYTTGSLIMHAVYSGGVALLFAMYLVYDTQQLIGGRKVELSPEEHIYAALQLYIDIIQIFLALLSLGSNCK